MTMKPDRSTFSSRRHSRSAQVDVTGGTLGRIGIIGLRGAGSNYCDDATSCQVGFPLASGLQVQLSSDEPFAFTCPGSSPEPAMHIGADYSGGCQSLGSVTDYHVTVDASPV